MGLRPDVSGRPELAARAPSMEETKETPCPVGTCAEVIAGKWTLLIIRDLARETCRFCELERSLTGISPRTLSLRLRSLEECGIVTRNTYPEIPPRVEYRLTDKGLGLVPLIDEMRNWGRQWSAAADGPASAAA